MSAITTIQGTDLITNSRTVINANFAALNADKIETSVIDTDTTLAANSDSKLPSQKAVKAYVDASVNPTGRSWNEYAASATGTDSYAITVSGVTAYVTGQTFKFKVDVANTGASTLNVNGLGAKTIKKEVSVDTATGDFLASQIVVVIYDGTNMQIISRTTASPTSPVVNVYTSSGTWTKPVGLKYITVEVVGGGGKGGTGNAANPGSSGAGGGGGGYSKETIVAASLGSTESYVVGAASSGSGGGTSSFGTSPYLQATGGSDGGGTGGSGGAGGIGSNGNINAGGSGGQAAGTFSGNYGGAGGGSVLGGGGFGGTSGVAGGAAQVYGGGGGGDGHIANGGGAGAAGVVIVTEFY